MFYFAMHSFAQYATVSEIVENFLMESVIDFWIQVKVKTFVGWFSWQLDHSILYNIVFISQFLYCPNLSPCRRGLE